jgi:hypothetical protein
MKNKLAGVMVVVLAIVAFSICIWNFEEFKLALLLDEDGERSEWYGIVAFFRWPIYFLFLGLAIRFIYQILETGSGEKQEMNAPQKAPESPKVDPPAEE